MEVYFNYERGNTNANELVFSLLFFSQRKLKQRSEKGYTMFKKVLIAILAILVCTVAAGAFYIHSKLNKINTEELDSEKLIVNEDLAEDLGDGYTTFAVFGVDSREGELEKGVRSDCIIVANLNNETKEVQLVSVYRDTILDMTDGSLHKSNSAYSYGGAEQAVNMLNMNLDLNITDYVTVDFTAVAEAIDLLGGVEINIKEEEVEYLNEFLGETASAAGKEAVEVTVAGLQTLDGVQATTYARIRSTAGGDFTRAERQRIVIEKMVEKAKISDFNTLNKIIDKVLPGIKTSFTSKEIINYARYFAEYKLTDSTGFPMEKTADRITGIGSVVIPVTLESNVRQLHEMLYGTLNYQVSLQVAGISKVIEEAAGTQEAQSNDEIYNQYYEDTEEDRQQEKGSSGSGSSSGSRSGSGTGGNKKNGSSSSGNSSQGNGNSNSNNNTPTPSVPGEKETAPEQSEQPEPPAEEVPVENTNRTVP